MTSIAAPASGASATVRARMRLVAERRFRDSVELPTRFFEAHADAISGACLAMARRFQRGGRLLVFGEAAAATDAQHVAVEFVHPVLVGKRALPALSLGRDPIALGVLGRGADIALAIASSYPAEGVSRALVRASGAGMLTIALTGGNGARPSHVCADHVFVVPSDDAMLVQEVQETLYHVLWELVHVFLDEPVTR